VNQSPSANHNRSHSAVADRRFDPARSLLKFGSNRLRFQILWPAFGGCQVNIPSEHFTVTGDLRILTARLASFMIGLLIRFMMRGDSCSHTGSPITVRLCADSSRSGGIRPAQSCNLCAGLLPKNLRLTWHGNKTKRENGVHLGARIERREVARSIVRAISERHIVSPDAYTFQKPVRGVLLKLLL
jgi:hypothetical protein